MSMLEKYQIVSMLGAGETSSFRAQEVATGRPVVVHQFLRGQTSPDQPDLMSMVLKYLSRADAPGIENFLDSGEDGDTVFIVTMDVPECQNLRQWLQSMAVALGDGPTYTEPAPADLGATQVSPQVTPDNLQVAQPAIQPEVDEFDLMFSSPGGQKPASGPSESKPVAPLPPPEPSPNPELSTGPAAKPAQRRSRGQVPSGFEVVYQSRKRTTNLGPPADPITPTVVAPLQAPAEAAGSDNFNTQFPGLGTGKGEPPPAQSPLRPDGTPMEPAPPGEKTLHDEFSQMFTGKGKTDQSRPPSRPATAKPPSQPAPPSGGSGPGEFTQMFQGAGAGHTKPPSTPPSPAPAPSAPPPQHAPEKSAAGEFTQMFSTRQSAPAQPAAPGPSPVAAKPAAAHPSPAQEEPGDFTLMFKADAQAPSKAEPPLSGPTHAPAMPPAGPGSQGHSQKHSAIPASHGDAQAPGEFTQMFKSGGEPARPPSVAAPSHPQTPLSSSSKKGPGDFTLMMQGYKPPATGTPAAPTVLETPKPSTPPPAADANKKAPGEFTLMFRAPAQPGAPVPPGAPQPPLAPPTPPPPAPRQPGEYTGLFEAPRVPQAAPQPAPQAAPPAGYGYPAAPVAPPPPQMPVYQPPPPPMAPQVAYPQPPQYQPAPPPSYAMAPPPAPQMQPMAMPPPPALQPMPPAETKKPMIFWILLMVLGCLFLATVGLILFFALKH